MANGKIASLFIENSSWRDRLIRKSGEQTYVVEYRWDEHRGYGGYAQKRHQRRYANLANAMRRLRYVIAHYQPEKAFILSMPVDVPSMQTRGMAEHAVCKDCGSTDLVLRGAR